LRHKGGARKPLAHFGVSGIEGVRGTHIRNREVVKPKIPFRVKVVVTPVGHEELRVMPCACCTSVIPEGPVDLIQGSNRELMSYFSSGI
jgi:hypothetical protein